MKLPRYVMKNVEVEVDLTLDGNYPDKWGVVVVEILLITDRPLRRDDNSKGGFGNWIRIA